MDNQKLEKMRHSCAHLLAAAINELFPGTKFGIGPVIENGFYYDFDLPKPISEEDLPKIEAKMQQIKDQGLDINYSQENIDQVLGDQKKSQPYKAELIELIKSTGDTSVEFDVILTDEKTQNKATDTLSFYTLGDFKDLCRGPHVKNTKEIGAFKLLSMAGAYWRGDEKNKMLTRIYGTAFLTQEELNNYLNMLEEAKKRDHRKIGKELDLFVISDLVGPGLPLFTPKGTIIRDELLNYSEKLQVKNGFKKVWIPHITKTILYKKSGHWDKFGDELFLVKSQETDEEFVLKPMNCPHHIQIYASRGRSYKELPIRYTEITTQYRDEKAGELLGLSRVRAITIDDAHIFCTMDQIKGEFSNIMGMIKQLYKSLSLEFKVRLSFRDQSDKYLGSIENWDLAQKIIKEIAGELDIDYFIAEGEAAFYGPKIDILVTDSLGRQWQCATEQLDFVLPERFGIKYVDKDGSEKTPVMIHKALLGSIERFLSVYLEHTSGALPIWLSPIQVKIIPITDKHNEYGQKVLEQLLSSSIRVEIDTRGEKMQSKIREAQLQKIPYMLIIGDKEQNSNTVALRTREGKDLGPLKVEAFLKKISDEILKKS